MPGKSKIQDHLDDLAQRHPEFAEQLKGWSELDKRDGLERQREEEEKREEPGPLRGGNLRNTVPDMQSSSQSHDETDRGQRSQSAPPESKQGQSGQFISKVDITNKDDKQNSSSSNQESSQQKVFHIPIYVEGRDEPIFPKEATEASTVTPKQNRRPSSNRVPLNETHKEPQQKRHHQGQSQSVPVQAQQPPPAPPPPPSPPIVQQHPAEQQQQQPILRDPLSQVASVLKEVNALKEKVDAFKGNSKKDKEYMYLDEMLTRNLLKLDNIDTDGKEEVRSARKEVIKRIQECITQLEAQPGINSTALVLVEDQQPSSSSSPGLVPVPPNDNNHLQQEQMEVPQNETI